MTAPTRGEPTLNIPPIPNLTTHQINEYLQAAAIAQAILAAETPNHCRCTYGYSPHHDDYLIDVCAWCSIATRLQWPTT